MRSLPLKARWFLAGTYAGGIGVCLWALLAPRPHVEAAMAEIALLCLLALITGGRKVTFLGPSDGRENSGTLTLGFILIFAGLLRGGPTGALLVSLCACLGSCLYPRRQPLHQAAFNLAVNGIATWLSGILFLSLNGGMHIEPLVTLPAIACAGLVNYFVNITLVSMIIGLTTDRPLLGLWKHTATYTASTYIAGALIIPFMLVGVQGNLAAVLLFGTPVAFLVYHANALHTELSREKEHHVEELQVSSDHIAELYGKAEGRALQERSLAHLGVLAVSRMSLDEWLQEASDIIVRTLEVELALFLERDMHAHNLRLRAASGWSGNSILPPTFTADARSMAAYAINSRSFLVVEDLAGEDRFGPGPELESQGVHSGITVIVLWRDSQTWGVISACARSARRFTEDQQAFLQSIANLAGLVLDRDRHAKEMEANSRQIDHLNEQLRQSMRETHHRVKNNLQIVAAMIDMQLMDDPRLVEATQVRRLSQHVRALAAIHEMLTDESVATTHNHLISAREALDRLMPLVQSIAAGRSVHCEVDDLMLPARQGTSLAVLLNELISNAVKHGMGDIDVSLAVVGAEGRLEVSDDGPGFPAGFRADSAAHTGLELVESLSRWDLQGIPHYENRPEGGARVVVTFPLPDSPKVARQ